VTRCPDPSVLEGFLQGTLDAARRDQLELHLDRCSQCAATVAELARVYGTVSASIAAPLRERAVPGQLGRYQLGRRLGQGGMGVVFEAHDPELHRRVAIKLLHPGASGDVELTRARMLREARAMAQLAHPNVVAVHDVGRVGEQVFVAMELVEGTTLTHWLQAAPRGRAQILAMFVQAGRGLQAAHAVGLVHRDFKPDNVLVGDDVHGTRARARVTDFGLARPSLAFPDGGGAATVAAAAAAGLGATTQGTSMHGAIVGTPAYMAPEQWRGATADARSDQFSFCVALYEALFHARPFIGADFYALAEQVLRGVPRPPPRGAPAWLRAAILRGLERDPAARHPSMAVLLDALERDRGRLARAAAVVAAMGVSAAATVAVLGWMSSGTPPELDVAGLVEGASRPEPPQAETSAATPMSPDVVDPRACLEYAADAGRSWGARRRGDLAARIDEMDHGEEIAARSLPILDDWAARWSTQATALCTAAASAQHDAQGRCLADARVRFDALLQRALDLPTFEVDDSLAAAVYRLPALGPCEDRGWLAVQPPAPPVARREQVALLLGDLAAAEALAALDRLVAAPIELQRVVADAQALEHAPLLAEAQLALGLAHAEKYEHDEAVDMLEAAAATAQGGVHERVLARAAIALVEQQGAGLLRSREAARWLRIATSQAERFGDPRLAAATLVAQGVELHALGELRDAVEHFELALPKLREALGEQHPELARARLELSSTLLNVGELDRAKRGAELAHASSLATLGPTDLRTAAAEALLARVLLAQGVLPAAREHAEHALHIPFPGQSLRHDYDRGRDYGLLGDVLAAQGAHADAGKAYRDAEIGLYTGVPQAEPLLWEGRWLLDGGEQEAGLARLDEALAMLESNVGVDDPRLLAMLRAVAAARVRAGAIELARATLLRALELGIATLDHGPRVGELQWDLAELERGAGDLPRALELLDDAHLPMSGALGQGHPRVVASVLARADLAFELGDAAYAGGLYGAVLHDLQASFGPKDPRVMRARARRVDQAHNE
jgi:eukaryotic-like serine/threonine-protein kinase